jgi:hypothetical protein
VVRPGISNNHRCPDGWIDDIDQQGDSSHGHGHVGNGANASGKIENLVARNGRSFEDMNDGCRRSWLANGDRWTRKGMKKIKRKATIYGQF